MCNPSDPASASRRGLDFGPSLLMWDMRRDLSPDPFPKRRTVVRFVYHDLPSTKWDWWQVIEAFGEVDPSKASSSLSTTRTLF
jgi:hypothetical protein